MDTISNGRLRCTITGSRRQGDRLRTDFTLTNEQAPWLEAYPSYVTEPFYGGFALSDRRFQNPHALAGFLIAFLDDYEGERFTIGSSEGEPDWGYRGLRDDLYDLALQPIMDGLHGFDAQCDLVRTVHPDWDPEDDDPTGLVWRDGDLCVDWSQDGAHDIWGDLWEHRASM